MPNSWARSEWPAAAPEFQNWLLGRSVCEQFANSHYINCQWNLVDDIVDVLTLLLCPGHELLEHSPREAVHCLVVLHPRWRIKMHDRR